MGDVTLDDVCRPAWLSAGQWVLLVALMLAYTKGPVFSTRLEVGALHGDFIDDHWVQATFVILGLAVIASGYPEVRQIPRGYLVAWLTLPIVLTASATWGIASRRSAEQGLMMLVMCVAAVATGARWTQERLVQALFVSMHIGLAASVWARERDWEYAVELHGQLAGVYFNRNSFGFVAVTALLSSVVLTTVVVTDRSRARRVRLAGLAAGCAFALLDLSLWRASGSGTPVISAVGAIVVGALILVAARRLYTGVVTRDVVAAVCMVCVLAVAMVAGLLMRSGLAGLAGRDATLTGRTDIWAVVWTFVRDRPLGGWGFMGLWLDRPIHDALQQIGLDVSEAHNGYLEVLVGGGVIALLALVAACVFAMLLVMRATATSTGWLLWWPPIVFAYVLLLNLTEVYIGANLLPWFLLGAVVFSSAANPGGGESAELGRTAHAIYTSPARGAPPDLESNSR